MPTRILHMHQDPRILTTRRRASAERLDGTTTAYLTADWHELLSRDHGLPLHAEKLKWLETNPAELAI
jgi:hypothetical protein